MAIRHITAAIVAAGALALTGCTSEIDGTAHPAEPGDRPQSEVTPNPLPEETEAPPLPLPETDAPADIAEESYIQALNDEGIFYGTRDDALALAETVCDEIESPDGDLLRAANAIASEGYEPDDAGFIAGAASITCDTEGGI